jgi:hypothetical protein
MSRRELTLQGWSAAQAAKGLGLIFRPPLLLRADQVIDP